MDEVIDLMSKVLHFYHHFSINENVTWDDEDDAIKNIWFGWTNEVFNHLINGDELTKNNLALAAWKYTIAQNLTV